MQKHGSITYEILKLSSGEEISPGKIITVDVERIMAHDGSGPVIAQTLERYGFDNLLHPDKIVFIYDHYYPARTEREASLQAVGRNFSSKFGISLIEGDGISHQVLAERGFLKPGTVFIGADSHSCTAGAFGVFGTGLGATDIAAVMVSGKLWIEVPELLRIRLHGKLKPGVSTHDLALHLTGTVGTTGALAKAIEFIGPSVSELSVLDRMKISNFAVEMGAISGIFGVDEISAAWLRDRGVELNFLEYVKHDSEGKKFDLEINLSEVERTVALPSRPDNIVHLKQLERIDVHQVFIGSCSGGRINDLRSAAKILNNKKVKQGVRLIVSAASREVMDEALSDGTIKLLIQAGANILPPGCGSCLGTVGALGPNEVEVSTQNRNFKGRAGSSSSLIYLVSPEVAALAAINGYIRDLNEEE